MDSMNKPMITQRRVTRRNDTKFSLLQFSLSLKRLNGTMIPRGISRSVKNININVAV